MTFEKLFLLRLRHDIHISSETLNEALTYYWTKLKNINKKCNLGIYCLYNMLVCLHSYGFW